MNQFESTRRQFLGEAVGVGLGVALASNAGGVGVAPSPAKKVRVGVIGCGSVSNQYLPNLAKCPYAEVVSVCDIRPERATFQAKRFGVANEYPHIDKMLAGVDFDLLVNLTDMQEHEKLNRQAIAAGKHVWSEKPIANTLAAGHQIVADARARGQRVWGAPIVVASPQFAFMAKALAARELGRVASATSFYGHTGPNWSAFFYEKLGGSMPDLGVYNLTSLTGLLGPAKSVTSMLSTVTPTRTITDRGEITVVEEDNAMVLMEHEGGALSHMQCGFNFFNPHGHEGKAETRHTISMYGSKGSMGLVGYDWEPIGVDLATEATNQFVRHASDAEGYVWQGGASLVCECLATGKEPLFTPEHALHVVEVITAARESQATGRRVALTSNFKWPIVT
ncbi:MAG: Gfo/Idh/MocA family protein [Lacipirellulaceae bacterium]